MSADNRDEIAARRSKVVGRMISSLRQGEPREYYVGLVGYFIEGIPYSASGISLDADGTPDIFQTDSGFTCTAFFPPSEIQPSTVKQLGVIQKRFGGELADVVKVRVDVKLSDLWTVAEFVEGTQHDLFVDPEAFGSRKMRFIAEMREWFERKNAAK